MVEISSKAKMSSFDTLLDASFIPCKMADLPAEVGEVEIEVASNGGIGVPEPQIEVETTAGNGVPEPQIEVETTVIDHGLTIEVQPGEEMVYIAANVGNDIEVDGADDIEEAEREDQPAKKKKDGGGEGKKARAPRASKGKAGANASRKAASTSPAVVASSFQGMDVTFEATGELFFFWRPFKLVKSMYRGIMCDRCRTALYFLSRASSFFTFIFFSSRVVQQRKEKTLRVILRIILSTCAERNFLLEDCLVLILPIPSSWLNSQSKIGLSLESWWALLTLWWNSFHQDDTEEEKRHWRATNDSLPTQG